MICSLVFQTAQKKEQHRVWEASIDVWRLSLRRSTEDEDLRTARRRKFFKYNEYFPPSYENGKKVQLLKQRPELSDFFKRVKSSLVWERGGQSKTDSGKKFSAFYSKELLPAVIAVQQKTQLA